MLRIGGWIVVALLAVAWFRFEGGRREAGGVPGKRVRRLLPGAAIFDCPTVAAFRIELSREALDSLRREPRTDVAATMTIDGMVFTNVAVHLKGAAGSFRGVDDQPAMTVSFSKFVKQRRWQGLRKIHLNNSVQDPSYMNEYLASSLFRAAGVPTPRVAFATVQLNRRKLGLYVLKEGFTDDFLECFFARTDGNLYDGGFVRDIDQQLELAQGDGVKDRSDLDALADAAIEMDQAKRWFQLQRWLDVDCFARYLAVSVFLADWDGYALNRNNYRIYFDPHSQEAVFLPHGMDQMFQRPNMEWRPWFNGIVARGFMDTPQGRELYERHFRELFPTLLRAEPLTNTVNHLAAVLRPFEPDIDYPAEDLRHRIVARVRHLSRVPQLQSPPPRKDERTVAR